MLMLETWTLFDALTCEHPALSDIEPYMTGPRRRKKPEDEEAWK